MRRDSYEKDVFEKEEDLAKGKPEGMSWLDYFEKYDEELNNKLYAKSYSNKFDNGREE